MANDQRAGGRVDSDEFADRRRLLSAHRQGKSPTTLFDARRALTNAITQLVHFVGASAFPFVVIAVPIGVQAIVLFCGLNTRTSVIIIIKEFNLF